MSPNNPDGFLLVPAGPRLRMATAAGTEMRPRVHVQLALPFIIQLWRLWSLGSILLILVLFLALACSCRKTHLAWMTGRRNHGQHTLTSSRLAAVHLPLFPSGMIVAHSSHCKIQRRSF